MATLNEQLLTLQQRASSGQRKLLFYPAHRIEELLTTPVIRESISSIPRLREDQLNLFASLIREKHLKTLAALLSIGHHDKILEFLFRRLNDDRIPYAEGSLDFLSMVEAQQFIHHQWKFIPVVLTKGDIHRQLHGDEILPFLEETHVAKGGFGTVYKVKLHPASESLVPIDPENVRYVSI
jgi:hypothetical protein